MFLVVKNKKECVFILMTILVFVMAFFIPSRNVISYNILCFALFIAMAFLFYLIKRKTNFFDFDSIFLLIYGIVAFLFPVFLSSLPTDMLKYFFNHLSFDYNLISKGAYIALLAITGYFFGNLFFEKKNKEQKEGNVIDTKYLIMFTLLCVVLFIAFGGVQYFQAVYLKDSNSKPVGGIVLHIIALLQSFLLVTIATEAYNISLSKTYKVSKLFILTCLSVSFVFLYVGSRTNASFFMLPLMYWYLRIYKPIGFLKFVFYMFLAIVSMWVIQRTRTGGEVKLKEGVSVFKDLVIVNRNTYIGIEYTDKYGLTYGKTMLSGVIGVVPSFERILTNLFGLNINDFGSAELFTDYTFGKNSKDRFGLGTNLYIDVYLSFGYVGTFLLFMLLGFVVKNSFENIVRLDYNSFIIFTILMANSVYLVRAGYSFPLKLIVWTLIIANTNRYLTNKIKLIIKQ